MKVDDTLAIFTLVVHKEIDGQYYGYAPYVGEMNIWASHFKKVIVVGPLSKSIDLENIDFNYSHQNLELVEVPVFSIKSFSAILKLIIALPNMILKMIKVMRVADYLHFRCPSNVSAVAAVVQIFFPNKPKSTKYAGNWNPKNKQPLGYRFQKWLLTNQFFTKNMKVLVYGDYPDQQKSVIPFMSATYSNKERVPFEKRDFSGRLKFVFIGAMVVGKRPKLTVQIFQKLLDNGIDAELHMFGDGDLIEEIRGLVKYYNLQDRIQIYGNRDKSEIKQCLLDAHFSILPSKSEGWPKAIAEGMFFGAIPISTKISCLPWILDYGNRGILIDEKLNKAYCVILNEIGKGNDYLNTMSKKAQDWAQQYTLERLEQEIEKVIKGD